MISSPSPLSPVSVLLNSLLPLRLVSLGLGLRLLQLGVGVVSVDQADGHSAPVTEDNCEIWW